MTQKEIVLKKLIHQGKKGLHSFWGYQHFIPRLGAIIYMLKREGYNIRSVENKGDNGCTYFLEFDEK